RHRDRHHQLRTQSVTQRHENTKAEKQTRMKSRFATAFALMITAAISLAQSLTAQSSGRGTTDSPGLSFETASIKPNDSGGRGSPGAQTPGRFSVTNTTVFSMIQTAYGIRDVQVIGGPGWMKTNRYDINAIRPANATRDQLPGMMRNLLVERFGLTVH